MDDKQQRERETLLREIDRTLQQMTNRELRKVLALISK